MSDAPGLELLAKAGGVVDALADGAQRTAADLAAATGQPVSSTYRLLTSLTALGWVEAAAARGHYRLGPLMQRLGAVCDDRTDLVGVAHPVLRELMVSLRASVDLVVPDDGDGVCVDKASAGAAFGPFPRIGTRRPLAESAAGLAILTALPPADRDRTAPPTAQLVEQPGVASFAAPCFNHRGEIVAALQASALAPALDESTASAVRAAARQVSAKLGWDERSGERHG